MRAGSNLGERAGRGGLGGGPWRVPGYRSPDLAAKGTCLTRVPRGRAPCHGPSREGAEEILCLGMAEEVPQDRRECDPGPAAQGLRLEGGTD